MDLKQIINALMRIETKGENTLILADCIRALAIEAEEIEKMEKELNELRPEEEENDETLHSPE